MVQNAKIPTGQSARKRTLTGAPSAIGNMSPYTGIASPPTINEEKI